MAQIHANTDAIEFDDGTADALVSALNGAAESISGQAGSRRSYVTTASQEFRGHFSQRFAENATTATGDAKDIAAALRTVAGWVGTMKTAAATERANRKKAREWQAREDDRNGVQDFLNDTSTTIRCHRSRTRSRRRSPPRRSPRGRGRRRTRVPVVAGAAARRLPARRTCVRSPRDPLR